MTNANSMNLLPGEINLDWVPLEWPLTPLGESKNPYLTGWQNKPQTKEEIAAEIKDGHCHAVGLIGGPCYNHPYGFVWVDVDGPSVYQLVEQVSGYVFEQALPPTLTICSGKEGRERRLYKLLQKDWEHLIRNKYVWHSDAEKEKLEILWRRHQGVLMGSHPETAGYFTPEGLGFEWCSTIPELPSWILEGIKNKNERQGFPAEERGRVVGPGFAINTRISLERDIQLAIEATWAMPPEAADDYDIWITAGQALHSLDESLLDVWEDWSKQSDKYRPGECQRRWKSFSKSGGRGVGSLIHIAKENGWQPKEHPAALNVSDDMLDHITKVLEEAEKNMAPVMEAELQEVRQETKQQKRLRGKEDGDDSKTKNKAASEISDMLLTLYKGDLRFSIPHSQFFMYQRERAGLWSPIMKVEMMGDIRNKLQDPAISKLIPQGFTARFLNDVYEQLQAVLCIKEWYEGNKYLLFTNGVLDVTTRELLPFKRELYLTQQIPYIQPSGYL